MQNHEKKSKNCYCDYNWGMHFFNAFLSEQILRLWEIPIKAAEELDENYDVGIVLGGGLVWVNRQNTKYFYGESAHRIIRAIEFYKAGRIGKILISDGLEHRIAKELLIQKGIPENDIILETSSFNTHENAVNTAKILKKLYPAGRFILFTSAWHMRRAKACFMHEKIDLISYSTKEYTKAKVFKAKDIIPTINSIIYWEIVFYELAGYLEYLILDYI